MALLLKDSDGKPSVSFTMVFTTFCVCLLWLTVSIINIQHIRAFDVTTASGFLSPLLALYFGRRWTKDGKLETTAPAGASPSQPPTE
jgi:hypothetical protein